MTLANMTLEETKKQNTEHCRHIADTLYNFAHGNMAKCDECGEVFNVLEDDYDGDRCPHCGEVCDPCELDLYDWLEDALDIEYCMSSAGYMLGARVLVAFGGPSIYVDTRECEVKLYWWTDRASAWIDRETCQALDDVLEECFEVAKAS